MLAWAMRFCAVRWVSGGMLASYGDPVALKGRDAMIRSAAAIVALMVCGVTTAATINVPADYTTIQAAVDAASNGDMVIVAPGTYTGTTHHGYVVHTLGKAITIKASGTPGETILDGEDMLRVVICSYGEGADTIIEGFTITGGYTDWDGGGIRCYANSSPTIKDCTISNNTASEGGGGIYCYYSSSPTLTGCTISGNMASVGGGIECSTSSSPTLTNCTITGNTAGKGGGISCIYISSPTITGCTISGNMASDGGGIYCYSGTSATLADTLVCSNDPDQIFGCNWTDNGGNTVSGECPICADVDGDSFVAVHDLLAVLEAWGSDDPDADVDGDGIVGMDDLEAVIANWGACP